MSLALGHPTQKLLFYVVDPINDSLRIKVRDFVLNLAPLRAWRIGPPTYVQVVNAPYNPAKGDLPLETLGAYLEIYTALPPWTLPREIDLEHFAEVTTVVTALQKFSRVENITFDFELDRVFVGMIERGEMDRTLAVDLIGEWGRMLGV